MTTTKKPATKKGARMYATITRFEGLDPAIYKVSTLVIRHDGKDMTGDEIAAVKASLRANKPAKPAAPKPVARVTTKAVPTKAATKKRVAAKRPATRTR